METIQKVLDGDFTSFMAYLKTVSANHVKIELALEEIRYLVDKAFPDGGVTVELRGSYATCTAMDSSDIDISLVFTNAKMRELMQEYFEESRGLNVAFNKSFVKEVAKRISATNRTRVTNRVITYEIYETKVDVFPRFISSCGVVMQRREPIHNDDTHKDKFWWTPENDIIPHLTLNWIQRIAVMLMKKWRDEVGLRMRSFHMVVLSHVAGNECGMDMEEPSIQERVRQHIIHICNLATDAYTDPDDNRFKFNDTNVILTSTTHVFGSEKLGEETDIKHIQETLAGLKNALLKQV